MTIDWWDSCRIIFWPGGSCENLSCFIGTFWWLLKKNAQIMQTEPEVRATGRQIPVLFFVWGSYDPFSDFTESGLCTKSITASFWLPKWSSTFVQIKPLWVYPQLASPAFGTGFRMTECSFGTIRKGFIFLLPVFQRCRISAHSPTLSNSLG